MANTACSIKTPQITSAFLSKEGNEILSAIKAPRYVDYINYLFGNVFKREYLDNNSYVTLSDFTDDNNKLTVNGNLNNLYGKVKEELKNQVNDPSFLINVSDEIKNQTASELIKILENWKLFVDYHSKYNAYIAINPEDLEEEKELNNFDKRGNEHNEFQLLTNEVRTLFKFLPSATLVKNSEGELVGSPIINPADGLPIRADFENVFKLTLDALKGIKDEDKFIQKLTSKEVLQRIPELSFIFDILPVNIDGTTNSFTNKQRQLFHHFFLVMSRDYIPVHASDLEVKKDDLPVFRRFKSARGNVDKIEKQFISNFLSNQVENDYVKIDNTVDEQNPENSVFGRKRLYSLPAKLPLIDLSDEEIKKLNRKSKILSDFKDYFDFFELLGIEFSDFSLISDKKDLIKVLNLALPIHDSLSERLAIGNKIFNPIEDLKQQIKYVDKNSKQKTIKSLRPLLRDIFKFEGSISKISPTLVTKAANGENQSDITYSNAISIAAQQINDSSSLDDLYSKPYFKKLKYNPLHKNSYVGSRVVGNPNISYSIENYSGFTIIEENESKSFDTKSLSDTDKFVSDFNNLMGWGVINTPQLESKAGYFAIKFVDKNTNKSILPFPESQFTNDFITGSDFTAQVIHYLHGEIERVRNFSKVKQYAPSNYGKFFIFNNFVTDEIKANLLKDKNTTDYKKAEEEVLIKLNEHFNNELKNIEDFIKNNDISNFISDKVLTESKISKELFKNNKEEYTKSLLRAFIANDFIHNVEFGIYVSGDPLFYKDYHKRLGGLSSTGTQPVPTNNLKQLFNSDSEKLFWDNFSLRGILNQLSTPSKISERRDNFHTFLSAVLKENNVKENTEFQNPKTIEDYIYSIELKNGVSITPEEATSDLKIKKIESKGIDVGDGQGYLNLDAARELSIKQGIYRPQQDVSYRFEALIFKQMLLEEKGEKLSEDEFKLLKKEERRILQNPDKYALPTLKQTYYGTISNKEVEIDAKIFDKFSLAVLLPSVARNHPELKKLLLAMAKRQIHYVKYESGTKGFVRDVFRNIDELASEKNELDELETSLLKLQITPSKTEKTSTKIPTQKIKLLFTNLFDGSKANESVKDLRNKFITDLNNIKNFNRKNVLKKLGFELNEEGKISSWDKEKIIDALVSQVNLQKLPTPMLEALETDDNGNFLNTIESSNIYQQLLNYVSGKLDSTLREFKINGGDFVLFSESMFSKPLKYVRLSKDRKTIENMDCRITLTKEYSKLLNLPDLRKGGELIGSVERLNELLTNAEFREKYKKELTIVFSRPPVQGPNSMGVASVVEFFHPTAGNILQLPKEFMHQAGIDFDYDKEKVILPSLSEDGLYVSDENITNKINELDSKYSELRDIYDYYQDIIDPEDFDSYEDYSDMKNQILNNDDSTKLLAKILKIDFENIPSKLNELNDKINEYFSLKKREKNILSNNLLDSIQKSLQQPEIYSELILPNTDETVKPLAIANGKDINNLNTLPQGIDIYSYFQNLKVFKLFNDAKALLGPFALHNVFIELIAPLDVKANLDYNYNKDGIPQKRVNLLLLNNSDRSINISSKYDINGNVKQHITSEFINATVDSAKDPYFANFMLSFDSINTFTFLMALGYPVDLIVDFTSSAAIRRYLMYKQRDLRTEEAVTKVLNEIKSVPLKKPLKLTEIFTEDLKNLKKDNSDLINKLKDLKSDDSLTEENYKDHFALLSNFVALEEHSKQFSNFRSLFRNDTNKTSSLYEISSKESLKKNVVLNGMFSLKDIENVENNSTISAFRNDDLIGEVLKTVFPLMSEPDVYKGLGDLFEDSKQNLKEIDKRILSQVITNDYITYILFSFGTYKNQNLFLYGRDLIIKTEKENKILNKTLLERLHKFKQNKAYESLTKQFPVLTKILGEISSEKLTKNPVYIDKNSFKHGFNIMLNIDSNIPILEKEGFMNQFKQILDGDFTTENPMVKTALINLIQDFFIAGLIQSGFNKTNISYLDYAPVKFIQSLLNPALERYNYNAKNNPEFLKKFVSYFSNSLFKFVNPKYFYFKKDDRSRIHKNTHLGKYLYVPNLIKTSTQNVNNINSVYDRLGNKTQSENVVIKPWSELKDSKKSITEEGIISTRIVGTDEHFGNIYSHDPAGKTAGLIKTETIKEAVEKYIDWVINGANFEKKNLFTVKPIQSVDKKATVKASIATQYIGFGEGINNSSTELYRQQAGKYANTGNYSERDTVFVSIGGKRGTEQQQKEQQDKTIKEALKAIEDGAILITDNKSYVDSNSYNTGEKRLAQNLTAKGYNYTEKTIDGQVLGVWYKGELNPLRSEWIREELKSEKHKGKTILYYKELGEPSHATALDYLINKYNWNTTNKTINIYSTDNNGFNELSNMLVGPVEFNGFKYKTIEHLYQWKKANFAGDQETANKIFYAKTGFEAQKLSKKIQGLDSAEWDKISSQELEEAMRLAYEQNPKAKELLLSTGNNILTHKGPFNMGKWETEFPRILMEIRDSFKNETKRSEEKNSKFLRTKSIITRDMVIGTPNILYIFGDNVMRAGFGGQAKEMRGEPNAYGIATKMAPSSEERAFFTDDMLDYNKEIILKDIQNIKDAWNTGKYTNITLPPIGEGLADLKNKAPKTWEFLQEELNKLENFVIKDPASTIKGETIDNEFKYYGATYSIKVIDGVAKDVLNLTKGSNETNVKFNERKSKILDAYNTNPNVDVQNGKQFRGDESTFANPNIENEKPANIIPESKYTFEYKGKSITTEFELGEQQSEALKALINFVEDRDSRFITLQGAAGTGKTTIIGYLQKYIGKKASFAYLAPTHAATAELAFATVKTGSSVLPSTLQSAITLNAKTKTHVFTQKIQKRLGLNPIIILDEASMIDQSDIDKLKEAIEDVGGKVIFLGDEKQISKVTTDNAATKKVSPAFTNFNQVRLTKIYRQSDNSLLNLLSKMREQTDFKLFKVENSSVVKFLNRAEFGRELVNDLVKDAENTVVVTYTNASVKGTNINIRQVLGRTGQTVVDDIIVGYLGYASKQIEKGDIANSISYKITDIEERGSQRVIAAKSSKLRRLIKMGIGGISETAYTTYYQLSKDDSLYFDNLNQKDFEENNKELSKIFKSVHQANIDYANKAINYQTYLSITAGVSETLRGYSVGNDYIYNPVAGVMERFDSIKHRNLKQNGNGSLLFNKDIDYGHAITIHKSQGSTIDNVYFDSNSLNSAKNTPIIDEKNNQITTEKMSLAYVAMSRSKNKLIVYEGDNYFELLDNNTPTPTDPNLEDIGFKKSCN